MGCSVVITIVMFVLLLFVLLLAATQFYMVQTTRRLKCSWDATAKPFRRSSAPGVVRGGRFGGRMLVDCEPGDALFLYVRCSDHSKGRPDPQIPWGETAASRQGCSWLDASDDLLQRFAVS